jgi:hypothetical protein
VVGIVGNKMDRRKSRSLKTSASYCWKYGTRQSHWKREAGGGNRRIKEDEGIGIRAEDTSTGRREEGEGIEIIVEDRGTGRREGDGISGRKREDEYTSRSDGCIGSKYVALQTRRLNVA